MGKLNDLVRAKVKESGDEIISILRQDFEENVENENICPTSAREALIITGNTVLDVAKSSIIFIARNSINKEHPNLSQADKCRALLQSWVAHLEEEINHHFEKSSQTH